MATTTLIDEKQYLKTRLFDRIERMHDVESLREFIVLLDEKLPEDLYELTPKEKRLIDEGQAELDVGLWVSGKEVERKTNEWLRKFQ